MEGTIPAGGAQYAAELRILLYFAAELSILLVYLSESLGRLGQNGGTFFIGGGRGGARPPAPHRTAPEQIRQCGVGMSYSNSITLTLQPNKVVGYSCTSLAGQTDAGNSFDAVRFRFHRQPAVSA